MALPDLTGQYIQDTYQRVLQKSGSGDIVDGTGSLFIPPNAISASYADFAVSASHEIIKEVSSSHADTASFAQSGDGIFSGSFSGSYVGDGSSLTGISPFPFTGDASITGSLIVSGTFEARKIGSVTDTVVIGKDAGRDLIDAANDTNKSVIIGWAAARTLTYGDDNTMIGAQAGYTLAASSAYNTFIGKSAGQSASPSRGLYLGHSAGYYADGNSNIFLGDQTGYGNASTCNGIYNIGIGYRNFQSFTTGDNNITIGYNTGNSITTGGSNIIIGSGSLGEAALEQQLRIGNGEAITTISASLATGDIIFPAAVNVGGTQRSLFTSCSLAYSGSNVTQVTQSFTSGNTQITDILYSGSFADGNPLSIAVTGSDGVNKLYTLTYSASLVTEILVT